MFHKIKKNSIFIFSFEGHRIGPQPIPKNFAAQSHLLRIAKNGTERNRRGASTQNR